MLEKAGFYFSKMKTKILLCFFMMLSCAVSAQVVVSGRVLDSKTNEPIIGAAVSYQQGKGMVTDVQGMYSFSLPVGVYSFEVSAMSYEPQKFDVSVPSGQAAYQVPDFKLDEKMLDVVEIVADMAHDRQTPIAFTNVDAKKISEELGGQDLPMLLNSTPGVYATQQGGGDGDARITLRGFNQRNLAVMIDGVPVNDMENGWVYWSNWSGLDIVTKNVQVQRGLGSSKIAQPSIGGTINIMTKGIDAKKALTLEQDFGSNFYSRTSVAYTSGRLKNGWGFTTAGSFRRRDGWVDGTWSRGGLYFFRVDKIHGNHTFSVIGSGGPQVHGQRSFKKSIEVYSKDYAVNKAGIHPDSLSDAIPEYGIRYNENWGYLNRWTQDENGNQVDAKQKMLSERVNYYHKPQISLRHNWDISPKLFLSNVTYFSRGSGGGSQLNTSAVRMADGTIDFQKIYDANYLPNAFNTSPAYPNETRAGNYLKASENNHNWYGLLSTLTYSPSQKIDISTGIDLRGYRGIHTRVVHDLLGADYAVEPGDARNFNEPINQAKRKGDLIERNYDGFVRWGGFFTQAEYKTEKFSAFINVSATHSQYKRVDYFAKRDLVLADTTLMQVLGYGETYTYNGQTYNHDSPEARTAQTEWIKLSGATIKGGANYNINDFHNVFFNTGFISRARLFDNVIARNNRIFLNYENEKVKAFELGYSFRHKTFKANINGYYTIWENKPITRTVASLEDPDIRLPVNINGMNALHKGIELDLAYRPIKQLQFESAISIGDWIWTSGDSVIVFKEASNEVDQIIDFNAKGVKVGDAAQTQVVFSVRYEPIENAYFKIQMTYFDHYYADFDPITLVGANKGRQSWKMPAYTLFDLHTGYKFKWHDKTVKAKLTVFNLLNIDYLTDAQNNDQFAVANRWNNFDAQSAGVFFGQGRRFTLGFSMNL